MVREIRDYGAGNLEAATDAFAANTNFTASDAEADKLYKEYLAARAEAKAAEPNDGLAGIHETGLPAAPDPDDMEEETT